MTTERRTQEMAPLARIPGASTAWPGVIAEEGLPPRVSAGTPSQHKAEHSIRAVLDRVGALMLQRGRLVYKAALEAVGDDKKLWKSFMRTLATNQQDADVAYGRQAWPELMAALELRVKVVKARGTCELYTGEVFHSRLTFTQKAVVCLRRIANPLDFDLSDGDGSDARCFGFARKVAAADRRSSAEREDRHQLQSEIVRLMRLRVADGSELRKSAIQEAENLLAWLTKQPLVEAKMLVPSEVCNIPQVREKRAELAAKLLEANVDCAAMQEAVGLSARAAKQIVRSRRAMRATTAHSERSAGQSSTRRHEVEAAALLARRELAHAMLESKPELSIWITKIAGLGPTVKNGELRLITTNVDHAAMYVQCLANPLGPGLQAVRVRLTRKDQQELTPGFVQSIRKALDLHDSQVCVASFGWKQAGSQIEKSRAQIVMAIDIADAEAAGRLGGLYLTASSAWKGRGQTSWRLAEVEPSHWQGLLEPLKK